MKGFALGEPHASIMLIVEIILLFLFLFFIYKAVLALLNPDLQVAVLNTELLRTRINEACLSGTAVTMSGFNFPQTKPSQLFGITDYLARYAIRTAGDPYFLLYYEAFPAGEAAGWELYHDFGNNIIVPFIYPGDPPPETDINAVDFVKKIYEDEDALLKEMPIAMNDRFNREEFRENNPEALASHTNFFVNNIRLHDAFGSIPAMDSALFTKSYTLEDVVLVTSEEGLPSPEDVRKQDKLLGEWDEAERHYRFHAYSLLPEIEKSFIKYRPCGANTLCLKTRDAVYTFPLSSACSSIEYMKIVYDARDVDVTRFAPVSVWTAIVLTARQISQTRIIGPILRFLGLRAGPVSAVITVITGGIGLQEILSFNLRYKVSDFYIASPCRFNGDIEISVLDDCTAEMEYSCQDMIKYPMYQFSTDSLNKIGDHYTCIDNLGDEFQDRQAAPKQRNVKCVQVKMTSRAEDFCFTRSPQVTEVSVLDEDSHIWERFEQRIKDIWESIERATRIAAIEEFFSGIGGLPVKDTTDFIYEDSIHLTPGATLVKVRTFSEGYFGRLGVITGKYRDRVSWTWPGPVTETFFPGG